MTDEPHTNTATAANETPHGFGPRLAWHLHLAWRASRFGALAALPGGFVLELFLDVRGSWLPAVVAAATGALSLVCIALSRHPIPPRTLDPGPALEKVGAADQVGHGLARTTLVLASFALGLWLGGLAS